MLRSKRTLVVLVVLVLVVISMPLIGTALVGGGDDEYHDVQDRGERAIGSAQASYPFDISDERALVGSADNVFVGRVLRAEDKVSSSDTSIAPVPQSQFDVEVIENVKGDLSGTVTVNQAGGYVEYSADRDYPEDGVEKGDRVRELILVDGDPLLEPEQEYMFLTAYDQKNSWHELVASRVGDIELDDQAKREAVVETYKKAKREQYDPTDVASGSKP